MKPRNKSALRAVVVLLVCATMTMVVGMFFREFLEKACLVDFFVTVFVWRRHLVSCPECGSWDTTKKINASRGMNTSDIWWFPYRVCRCGHLWQLKPGIFLTREEYSRNSRYW